MIPVDRPPLVPGHAGQNVPGQGEPPDDQPLILTLGLHADDQARFDRLRTLHFPPSRNLIQAHLTLFHHLPGRDLDAINSTLATHCRIPAFPVQVNGLRSLGGGVAYTLGAPDLARLRASLAAIWADQLTPQDRQGFRPHITIQNKVSAPEARALLHAMQAGFTPFAIRAEALLLWRYLGGPWASASRHAFLAQSGNAVAPTSTPPSIPSG